MSPVPASEDHRAVVRWIIGPAAILVALTVFSLGVWALAAQTPNRLIVIGGLTGEALLIIALIISAVALSVACVALLPGAGRVLAIPPALGAVALFVVGAVAAPAPLAGLKVDGCSSRYLVADQLPGELVAYGAEGVFAREVVRLSRSDAFGAFTNRRYRTAIEGSELHVWYESSSARSSRDLTGAPALVLPVSDMVTCSEVEGRSPTVSADRE
ncbi:MAG TPA: hypothetical protein DHW40_00560 [Microbacterium sp.]|nr:hypothetical protein [Microbacterium sp.]